MEVVICPDSETAEALVARMLAERIQAKPEIVLGLATGRTMERVYAKLRQNELDYAKAHSFNLDEYIGLKPDHEQSYWHYMHEHLFNHVNMKDENIHVPNGVASDLKKAARDYEELISGVGGVDVQLLGIGRAGHIGFNEPLSSFSSRTRDKTLTQMTLEQNAPMFGGDINDVPKRALTMGVGTILEARELILLATGAEKADILARAVEGPMTSMISATAIQLHPNCKIIIDEAASVNLQNAEFYRFAFHTDPDWADYQEFGV